MGQAASKAKEAAINAAKEPQKLSKAIQTQRTRSAAESQWKKQTSSATSTTTSSTGEYSPTRGNNHHSPSTTTEKMPEMPPDLIQFLNDAGPLQRTIDKDRTSSKVYDALLTNEQKIQDEHMKQANLRVRRRMPICLLYTSPSPRDAHESRMPSSA